MASASLGDGRTCLAAGRELGLGLQSVGANEEGKRGGAGGKQGQIQIQQVQLTEGRGEQTGSEGN